MYSVNAGRSYHCLLYSRMLSKIHFQQLSLTVKNVPAYEILS